VMISVSGSTLPIPAIRPATLVRHHTPHLHPHTTPQHRPNPGTPTGMAEGHQHNPAMTCTAVRQHNPSPTLPTPTPRRPRRNPRTPTATATVRGLPHNPSPTSPTPILRSRRHNPGMVTAVGGRVRHLNPVARGTKLSQRLGDRCGHHTPAHDLIPIPGIRLGPRHLHATMVNRAQPAPSYHPSTHWLSPHNPPERRSPSENRSSTYSADNRNLTARKSSRKPEPVEIMSTKSCVGRECHPATPDL
jgi:hypothetical protein